MEPSIGGGTAAGANAPSASPANSTPPTPGEKPNTLMRPNA